MLGGRNPKKYYKTIPKKLGPLCRGDTWSSFFPLSQDGFIVFFGLFNKSRFILFPSKKKKIVNWKRRRRKIINWKKRGMKDNKLEETKKEDNKLEETKKGRQ